MTPKSTCSPAAERLETEAGAVAGHVLVLERLARVSLVRGDKDATRAMS